MSMFIIELDESGYVVAVYDEVHSTSAYPP